MAPVGVLVKAGMIICSFGQTMILLILFTLGVGRMVTLKFMVFPVHPFNVGVTIILPVTLAPEVLGGALHGGILPEPLASIPIAILEFDQIKFAPDGVLEKFPMLIKVPGQTVIFEMLFATGVGCMVIVKVMGSPWQPLRVGVAVIVDTIGVLVELTAIHDGILLEPLATSPMLVFELVQVKVALAGVLSKGGTITISPEQTDIFEMV